MSNRYGSRDIQNSISETEAITIINEAESQFQDVDLNFNCDIEGTKINMKNILKECYRLDENETPRKYRLLNIDEILPGYSNVKI